MDHHHETNQGFYMEDAHEKWQVIIQLEDEAKDFTLNKAESELRELHQIIQLLSPRFRVRSRQALIRHSDKRTKEERRYFLREIVRTRDEYQERVLPIHLFFNSKFRTESF